MCSAKIFNDLPKWVRERFGQKMFSSYAKKHFDEKCQHPGNFERCKFCDIPASKDHISEPHSGLKILRETSETEKLAIDIFLHDPYFKIYKKLDQVEKLAVESHLFHLFGIIVNEND